MYDMREAMAYSGHLPAQQQQGITPELLDLLAMQKVDADKKAAAQAMALQSGQTPPTVAESLKQTQLQNARAEVAKQMGLGGLMQRMQAQQGPSPGAPAAPGAGPAMPPPGAGAPNGPVALPQGGPPQGMAHGGLAYIPSNLPKSYANGGIVAFEGGEQVPDPNDFQGLTDPRNADAIPRFQYAPGDTINDKARKDALRAQFVAAQQVAMAKRSAASDAYVTGARSDLLSTVKNLFGSRADNNNYGNEGKAVGQLAGSSELPAQGRAAAPTGIGTPPAAPMPSGPTGNSGAAPMPAGPSGNTGAAPMPSGDETQNGRLEVLNQDLRDAMQRVQANPNDASSAQDVASLQREIAALQKKPGAVAYDPRDGGAPSSGLQAVAAQAPQPTPGVATFSPPGVVNRPAGGIAGQQPPNGDPLTDAMQKSILGTLGRTRGDVTNEQDAMYNKYTAPGLAGIIANKQAALEELKALQAKQSAARPSDFMRALQLMGQNVHSRTPGLGGAFENVSTGMDATHQGYAAQDIASMQNRQALLNDITQAQQTNDIGRYQGAVAALKEHDASVNAAQSAGKSILDTRANAAERLAAAQLRAEGRPSGNEKAMADAEAAYARDPEAKNIQKQLDARLQPGFMQMNPNAPTEEALNARLKQILNQHYVQHGVSIAAPITTSKPGFSIALNK